MPAKVHLRLRFQNPGKPRTAGLCGREGPDYGHLSLSCTKIERPSLLEKPSCKVRLFAQNRSRKYRQKVTVTTLLQIAFHRVFQLLSQMAHVRFHRQKWVTPPAFQRKIAHSGPHAETGAFRTGVVSLPSDRSARFGNPAWPGFKTANFAAFGAWSWVLPKNAESLRDSDALMRVAVPRRRGPAGLRDPVVPLLMLCFCPCSQNLRTNSHTSILRASMRR